MPKIFIRTIIIVFTPFFCLSQEIVDIKHLSSSINTLEAEFNFLQINNNTALYTSSTLEDGEYQSLIFKTTMKLGEWGKGKYFEMGGKFSVGNICSANNDSSFYFTLCNKNNHCKIGKRNLKSLETEILNDRINLINTTSTHPNIAAYKNQNVLYFVSDRKGGFGGTDIWFSIIDKFGNYGEPINAGEKINTQYNEVTPFYNIWTEELFFSSDKNEKNRGFEIYKSLGHLNLWEDAKNVDELNSDYDDLYINFYNKDFGYIASNRSPSLYKIEGHCCNDIFSFKYRPKDSLIINFHDTITSKLPIELYFHNDEPGENTFDTTTKKTYKEAYISYYLKRSEYIKMNDAPEIDMFFEETLKGNYNELNAILEYVLVSLQEGSKMELHIKGYASPLHKKEYNINLSKRRISSFMNLIYSYESGDFNTYIKQGHLKIVKLPFGEVKANQNVSDNPNDRKKSVYSIDAMLERKIEIVEVIKL